MSIQLLYVNLMQAKKIIEVECELDELMCNAPQAPRYQTTG